MSEHTTDNRNRKRALVIIILLLLLLGPATCLFWPKPKPPVETTALLVPAEVGRKFGLQGSDAIVAWCRSRDKVRAAAYEGRVRGAHGALWGFEANDADRAELAAAALKGSGVDAVVAPGAVVAWKDGDKWKTAAMGDPGAPIDSWASAPAAAGAGESDALGLALRFELDDATTAMHKPAQPVALADCVWQPLLLSVEAGPKYRLRLGKADVLVTPELGNVLRATLEISWRSEKWSRELFHRASAAAGAPGRKEPREGDLHAIVVAGGPLVKEVLATRAAMLESAAHTPVDDARARDLILLGVKYQVDLDAQTEELARDKGVSMARTTPRIAIVSSEIPLAGGEGRPSMDVLDDRVDISGARARDVQVARSMAADLLETRLVFDAARVPVVSASTVFSHFHSDRPDAPARRVARIAEELRRILADEAVGARLTIGAEGLSLVAERTAAGFTLRGVAKDAGAKQGYALTEGASVDFGSDATTDLAVIADVLLADRLKRPDHLLTLSLERVWPTDPITIAPGSILRYKARQGGKDWIVSVPVSYKDGVPVGAWVTVPAGVAWSRTSVFQTGGAWPDMVTETANGPAIDALLVPAGLETGGEAVEHEIKVGTQVRKVACRKIALPTAVPWIEVKGKPAVFVRKDGIVQRGAEVGRGGNREWFEVEYPDGGTRRVDIDQWKPCPPGEKAYPALPAGHAVVLGRVLVEWTRGETSVSLEMVSPAVHGRLFDDETKLPVVGAEVGMRGSGRTVRSAADGTFVIAVNDHFRPTFTFVSDSEPVIQHPALRRPKKQRTILIVDGSGSMSSGLVADGSGGTRLQALKRLVKPVFDAVLCPADQNDIDLWTVRELDDPSLVTVTKYSESKLKEATASGRAPLAAAIHRLAKEPDLPADTFVILFSSGENSGAPAAQAYRDSGLKLPVHVIGLGVTPGSAGERDLLDLVRASAGTYRHTDEKAPFGVQVGSFQARAGHILLDVTSTCHAPRTIVVPFAEAGAKEAVEPMFHDCKCNYKVKRLITVTNKNIGDLDRCRGLSWKARAMIEARVADEAWSVTIPSQRVNIGSVSTYGWWETHRPTGRMVGRTEDGLHGSGADGDRFPPVDLDLDLPNPADARKLPFVAWYHGLVVYTAGSVVSAMKWTKEPGFLEQTPDDLKRFIQANALDFSANWFEEVGSGIFPESADFFWSGVCMTYTLQSAALGMPNDACHRRWAKNFCDRVSDAFKEGAGEMAGDAWDELLEDKFGEEHAKIVDDLTKKGLSGPLDEFNKWWDEGVKKGFDCDRFTRKDGKE